MHYGQSCVPPESRGFVAVAGGGDLTLGLTAFPGDLNCDGVVNFDDINPFVSALVGRLTYQAEYPRCHWLNGDIDGNGRVDFDDISPFVECLVGSGCP
jgi:hypothetical protein